MKKISVLARLFLLGSFLFVINALGHYSSARDNNILGQKENQNELEVTRTVNSMFAHQKESSDGITGGHHHHVRKLGLGGKKPEETSMVYSMKGKGEEEEEDDDGGGGGTSKISAEVKNDAFKHKSMGSLEAEEMDDLKLKDDDDKSMVKQPKAVQVKGNRLSSTSTRPERQISEEDEDQKEEEEEKIQKAFEVEEEIVNLIHKDYKGMARRKPPINNHEPRN